MLLPSEYGSERGDMTTIPIVLGGLALIWLVKSIFTTIRAVVDLVETLLTFPPTPVHDQ
jgi:hypothetical protein